MDNLENLIWDTITRSAKTRFNYSGFEKKLNAPNDVLIDVILFTVINELAKGESKKNVVTKVLHRVMLNGLNWEEYDIKQFVDEKEKELDVEIHTANVVNIMLKEHKDLKEVLTIVTRMLN